jgi:ABC-type glycerol-3-phosphate transport system substrate-binding protein
MKTRTLLALAATCVALAACGGGGSDGAVGGTTTTTTTTNGGNGVPQSAQASVAGLIAYLQSLIAGSNDTGSPVSLEGVTLPVDDAGGSSPI